MDTDDSLPKNKGGRPAGLTQRQREFAKFYVDGRWSNAECARKAGYADGSAAQHAAKLLDGRSFPDVPELIKELREARERKYGVTLMNQLIFYMMLPSSLLFKCLMTYRCLIFCDAKNWCATKLLFLISLCVLQKVVN